MPETLENLPYPMEENKDTALDLLQSLSNSYSETIQKYRFEVIKATPIFSEKIGNSWLISCIGNVESADIPTLTEELTKLYTKLPFKIATIHLAGNFIHVLLSPVNFEMLTETPLPLYANTYQAVEFFRQLSVPKEYESDLSQVFEVFPDYKMTGLGWMVRYKITQDLLEKEGTIALQNTFKKHFKAHGEVVHVSVSKDKGNVGKELNVYVTRKNNLVKSHFSCISLMRYYAACCLDNSDSVSKSLKNHLTNIDFPTDIEGIMSHLNSYYQLHLRKYKEKLAEDLEFMKKEKDFAVEHGLYGYIYK